MAAGLGAYGQVLADPSARAFSLAGFVARLPLSMTGLGVVLLVSVATGSFGRAGLVTGVATLTGAVSAPLWGRAMDRVGQARVLVTCVLLLTGGLAGVTVSVLLRWPLVVTLAAAVVVGAGFSSAGSAVRARWSARLTGSPLLDTAFALEAVVDEVVFIIGPVLVTFLSTTVHPAAGLAVSASLGLVGAFALAAQRRTQPPAQRSRAEHAPGPLPLGSLLPLALACAALGVIFGAMEVSVVAFARSRGVLGYSGAILMCWAFGSLLSGLVTGAVTTRFTATHRLQLGGLLLAASLVPLPFVDSPVVLALLLSLGGMAIAPTLIATVAVVQSSVPARRLSEGLGYTSTGLAGGLAAGAAMVGQVIDSYGPHAGFGVPIVAGVLLVVTAALVRSPTAAAQSSVLR